MTDRKKNVLKAIDKKGEQGIWVKEIEPTVLDALIADESVYLYRKRYAVKGRFYTNAVSMKFPQPDKKERQRRHEEQQERYWAQQEEWDREIPAAKEKRKGKKKTVKWTKERHQKLLLDALRGKADEEVVEQVTKTKTLPKKVVIRKNK